MTDTMPTAATAPAASQTNQFGTRPQGRIALQKPSPMPFQRYVPFRPLDLPGTGPWRPRQPAAGVR